MDVFPLNLNLMKKLLKDKKAALLTQASVQICCVTNVHGFFKINGQYVSYVNMTLLK